MIRAAVLSVLLLAFGAQAEECGVSGTKAMAPFKGTWTADGKGELGFNLGTLSYKKPDMAKPARLHVVEAHSSEEADDVALDCEVLDAAGIDRLVAKLEDYVAWQKDSPDYGEVMEDIASIRKRLAHPPYPLVTATYYEWVAYYIRIGKDELLGVETGEAMLGWAIYKKKD